MIADRWIRRAGVLLLCIAIMASLSLTDSAINTAHAAPFLQTAGQACDKAAVIGQPPVDFFSADLTTKGAAAFEQLLKTWGFAYFPQDGVWTAKDAYALRLFQRWAGLPITGAPDTATRNRLLKTWNSYGNAAIPRWKLPLEGRYIGLNAGHQSGKDSTIEAISPDPGSPVKRSVSVGTCGRFTHIPEYKLNLKVALKLRDALEAKGAMVYMVRTINDVKIGNARRCILMNKAGVDLALVIHADGNNSPAVRGLHVLLPGERGYQRSGVLQQSGLFARIMLAQEIKVTGAKNKGLSIRRDLLSFNWCKMPVCLVEMGYMTNRIEDNSLNSDAYQRKLVGGMVEGIAQYYSAVGKIK